MDELLEKLDHRQLKLIMIGTLTLLTGASFAYVVWPQTKAYREALHSRAVLDNAGANENLPDELARLRDDVAVLQQRLHGDMANLPAEQMEAYIVGRLQGISWRNRVELVSVEPREGDMVEEFREILFKVELAGNYFDLYEWVREVARELGFVVIKEYEMSPLGQTEAEPRLAVKLTLASYRAMQP